MAAPDATKPELTSLTLPDVDVRSGSKTVTLTAGAFDGGAGVERVYVSLDRAIQGSSGLTTTFLFFDSQDSYADGFSSLAQLFAATTAAGTYNVSQVMVYDKAGNSATYSASELAAAGIDTSFNVLSNTKADVSKPVLTSLSFPDVDVTAGPATVSMTAAATDQGTGVDRVYVALDRAIQGPNGLTYAFLFFDSNDSYADGRSSAQSIFETSTAAGTYNIAQVMVYDKAGNYATYDREQLAAAGIDTSFDVASKTAADLKPPVLTSLSLPDVDITAGSTEVAMTAGAADAGSGVDRVYVALDHAIQGPDGPSWAFLFFDSTDSYSDGFSSLHRIFDGGAAVGTYNISQVMVYDKAGNSATYDLQQLAAMGLDTSFEVYDRNAPVTYQISPDSESVHAGAGDDLFQLVGLSFGAEPVTIDGGDGNDTFDARQVSAGDNYLFFTDASFSDPSGAAGTFNVGDYVVSDVEVIWGSSGKNWFLLQEMVSPTTLHGGEQADWFATSFDQADIMYGHGGDDHFVVRPGDNAYGGAGADSFELAYMGTGVADGGEGVDRLELSFGWAVDLVDHAAAGPAAGSRYEVVDVEDVEVHAWMGYASSVAGDAAANRLSVNADFDDGSVGVDFSGRGGNDLLEGSAAADRLDGGAGDDTLAGGLGDDRLVGGVGNDTASYAHAGSAVTVNLGLAEGQDTMAAGVDTLEGIENLVGSAYNDVLAGNDVGNRISGGDGDDRIDGGKGVDVMAGGLGNDRYIVDIAADQVLELAGQGNDTVDASVSYTLAAGSEIETLRLIGGGALRGTGNEFGNTIVGNREANVLDGGAGADTLQGGLGNDRYIVDNAGDKVIEKADEGIDLVEASVSFSLAGQFVEKLTLTGTAAIDGTGNGLANLIIGNNQANRIDGGTGADEMIGRKGDDTYVVDNVADKVVELDGEGSDIVNASVSYSLAGQFAEVLNLTGSAVNGTGNGLANRIVGNELANTINGGAGNDRLDGGAGADTMVGGTGNDVFVVDNVGDKVGEKVGEGTDTVEASISYSLAGQYIEVLKLTGAADLSATGNNQANSLFGNAGANLLDGKGGADTMAGGAGNDRYVVDDAGDKVVELAGEGTDSVEASVTFSLAGQYAENLTLTGSGAINGTGNGLANILIGNGVANTLSGGAGDDVVNGGLGSDKLYGGTGADVFVFDTGLGANNVDQVLDFVAADDTIRLDRSVFGALAEGALSASVFVAGTAAVDADDRIVFDKATGNLWYDADGNGAGAAVLFANFRAGEVMSAADFVVVA